MKFLLLLIIPIYKYLINSYRLNRIEELYKYFQALKSESPNKEIYETRSETLELFEIAKINDIFIYVSENVGYDVKNSIVSVLNNYPNSNEEFYICQNNMFLEAIGTFKKRKNETFSLIYWLETIAFLPQKLLSYFNLVPNSFLSKIFNCIYWLISFLFTFFREEIKEFVLKIIEKLS
jgi:hypothetical protein|nr:MAG TPA: hypothetical protein [Caudoviricetes sp.]